MLRFVQGRVATRLVVCVALPRPQHLDLNRCFARFLPVPVDFLLPAGRCEGRLCLVEEPQVSRRHRAAPASDCVGASTLDAHPTTPAGDRGEPGGEVVVCCPTPFFPLSALSRFDRRHRLAGGHALSFPEHPFCQTSRKGTSPSLVLSVPPVRMNTRTAARPSTTASAPRPSV